MSQWASDKSLNSIQIKINKAEKISAFEPCVRTDFNSADISYRVARLIALLTCFIKKISQKAIETHL